MLHKPAYRSKTYKLILPTKTSSQLSHLATMANVIFLTNLFIAKFEKTGHFLWLPYLENLVFCLFSGKKFCDCDECTHISLWPKNIRYKSINQLYLKRGWPSISLHAWYLCRSPFTLKQCVTNNDIAAYRLTIITNICNTSSGR